MKKFTLLTIMLIVNCYIFSQYSVGFNNPNPANCTNDASIGTLNWNNPGFVDLSDNTRASTTMGSQGITKYLKSGNYGFIMPPACPTCVVTGVEAQVERRSAVQPDVAILNGWQAMPVLPLGGPYNYSVAAASPPAIMNRALVVVIGIENGPSAIPILPPLPNNDSRDVISVTYGGVPMTQVCEVAYSNILSGTTFWARNEIWVLNDAGISSAIGTQIVVSAPGNSYEFVQMVSAVSFRNVDQIAPIFDSRIDTVVGNINPFALSNPAPMIQGSCAITSIVCGNNGSYVFNGGGASGIPGVNFIEGTDQNGSVIPGYGGSSATMMCGNAIVPNGVSGSVAPTYNFVSAPNRQVISMICVQRARDFDNSIKLTKLGVPVGTNYANPVVWPVADAYQTYGGVSNMWGTTLSVADVTNIGFGLAVSARVQNQQVEVDHVKLKIYLTNPLPVELVDFNGNRINRDIQIAWSTSSENNNDYFELHKSLDAIEYNLVSIIDGAGYSNNLLDYIYNDMNAKVEVTNYYKIKQVDFDGNFKWFGPISIQPGEVLNSLSVFPNPATTTITVNNIETLDNYCIYNSSGQVVKIGKMVNGIIDIDELGAGMYYLSVADNGEKVKFLKF